MPTTRYGLDAYLYYNTGNYGTPSWTSLQPTTRDVTVNMSRTEGDISSRGSGIKCTAGVMRDISIDVEMLWDAADTGFQVLLDSFNGSAGSVKEILCIDRATGTGAEGVRAHMSIVKFDIAQPLEGAQIASLTFKPGAYASGEAPAWYTGA